jgi:RimJ/RimL family protein N-acetyltransferase
MSPAPLPAPDLATDRLVLRHWRVDDLAPLFALNAHPEVARLLANVPDRAASDAWAERAERLLTEDGLGPWAVATKEGVFVGAVGLRRVRVEDVPRLPFAPAVEVLWRVDPRHQGRGFATEAAAAALRHGFDAAGLAEIVAFTANDNLASRRVMTKLGMRRDADADFLHPALPVDHPLARHVLYRVRSAEFLAPDA